MATWKNALITQTGLNLQAKLQKGSTLLLTKAVTGTDYVNPDALIRLTDITNQKQTLILNDIIVKENGIALFPITLTNIGLTEGYTLNQIGVFAQDPDLGEILYFVAQAEQPDPIPTASQAPDFSIEYSFDMIFGNAGDLEVKIDPTALATKRDILAIHSELSTKANATDVVRTYTHAKAGTVHALTGAPDAKYIRFNAAADYTEGDTWTLNGAPVTVKTLDTMPSGTFKRGDVIVAVVDGTAVTLLNRSYQDVYHKLSDIVKPVLEFDLPLKAGYTSIDNASKYSKTLDGVCTVSVAVRKTDGITGDTAFATLPEGFRPSRMVHTSAFTCTKEFATYSGSMRVFPDGNITAWFNSSAQMTNCIGGFSFTTQ